MKLLAVDPGTAKCGLAVVSLEGEVLERRLVPTAQMQQVVEDLAQRHAINHVVVGNSTSSAAMRNKVRDWLPQTRVDAVDERRSTLEARRLYWDAYPPHGWRRLLPLSLQVPPEPVDDFAAVVLALRYMAQDKV